MNSDKPAPSYQQARQRGNVMIYILIALGLIGALTVAMTRQGDQSSGENLDQETATLHAAQIVAYAASASTVINQMMDTGTDLTEFDFAIPSDTSFNTAPYIHKFFHPQGGGLNYKTAAIPPFVASSSGTPEGWYVTRRNVTWAGVTKSAIILAAYTIDIDVCRAINKKINGTAATVALAAGSTRQYFTSFATSALTTAVCPACEGYTSLCVVNPGGADDNRTFYTILEMR